MLRDSGFAPKYPVCFIERPWYDIIRAYFLYHLFRRGRAKLPERKMCHTIFVTVRQPQMQVMVNDAHDFNEILRVPATQPRQLSLPTRSSPRNIPHCRNPSSYTPNAAGHNIRCTMPSYPYIKDSGTSYRCGTARAGSVLNTESPLSVAAKYPPYSLSSSFVISNNRFFL